MSDYEKDPTSGSTKEKTGREDRWTNEGGAPQEKHEQPSMSASKPRTEEGDKYAESEGDEGSENENENEESASERSEREDR